MPLARATDDLVVLYGPQDEPEVRGHFKPRLGLNAHRVILTLIEAGDAGLSLCELRNQTDQNGARNTLIRLANGDADWKYVIRFPGQSRLDRYRIGHPGYAHPQGLSA